MAQRLNGARAVWVGLVSGGLCLSSACGSSGEADGTGGSAGASDDGGEESGGSTSSGGQPGIGGAQGSGGEQSDASGGRSGPSGSGGGSGGQGGAPNLPETLQVCNMGGAASIGDSNELLMIDAFDDDDALFSGNGLDGGWYAYGDGTDGVLETSEGLVPVEGGVNGGAFRVQAGGFSAWGSVFGAYFSEGCLFDGSAYDGLTFYARGHVTGAPSGEVTVRLVGLEDMPPEVGGTCEGDCWNSHHVDIEVDQCWKRYSFRFDEFLRDGSTESDLITAELYLIDFAIGMADSSDIKIDELAFFRGETPGPDEICD